MSNLRCCSAISDRFKQVNDSLGHGAGDAVLRELGRRISNAIGEQDWAARCGGDEFGLMLRHADQPARPSRKAHELLALIREPMEIDGKRVDLTTSIGIATFPHDGQDVATLLRRANAAVKFAKSQGCDGYRYFTAALDDDADARFELQAALRTALRENQFRLHYQPKVSLTDGQVIGLEALLRWEHPVNGLMAPGLFLLVAQEAGLMPAITEWVVQEACRQYKQWHNEGLSVGRLSINLDVGVVQPTVLEKMLLQTVRDAGIRPSDLEFEILETAMHDDPEVALLWEHLVSAGFQLSIDDFGTGESSLSRLKRLPVNTLKIDRKFVVDVETHEKDRAMVRTIIAMAKSMDKEALVEGVETEQQLRYLIHYGCDVVQGYYFCKPCAAADVEAFVRGGSSVERVARLREQRSSGDGVVRYLESANRRGA